MDLEEELQRSRKIFTEENGKNWRLLLFDLLSPPDEFLPMPSQVFMVESGYYLSATWPIFLQKNRPFFRQFLMLFS